LKIKRGLEAVFKGTSREPVPEWCYKKRKEDHLGVYGVFVKISIAWIQETGRGITLLEVDVGEGKKEKGRRKSTLLIKVFNLPSQGGVIGVGGALS